MVVGVRLRLNSRGDAETVLCAPVQNHELSISLEHFDTKEEDNVKFYTDEEGFPYYGN